MIDIKYRILDINEIEHSVTVRFYTDTISEDDLASEHVQDVTGQWSIRRTDDGYPSRCQSDYSITIWDMNSSVEQIHKQIQQAAPAAWLKLRQETRSRNRLAIQELREHIGKEHRFTHPGR